MILDGLFGRPALSLFALANAVIQAGLYVRHESRLRDIVLAPPGEAARWSFVAWTVALVTLIALVVLAAGWLEDVLRPRRERSWAWAFAVLVEACAVTLIVLDTRVFETMGLHIYSPMVMHAWNHPGAERELHLGGRSTLSFAAFSVGMLCVQVALAWGIRKVVTTPSVIRRRVAMVSVVSLAGGLAAGATASVALRDASTPADASYLDALPFYDPLLGEPRFFAEAGAVRYPPPSLSKLDAVDLHPVTASSAESRPKPPDIAIVLVESLRADHLTEPLMPKTRALLGRRDCFAAPRHYSGGHTTEYGTFTLLYGLHGYHYEPFSDHAVASLPLELLDRVGYRRIGASASALRDWNAGAFMFEDFDVYEEILDVPADEGDPIVVERLLEARADDAGPTLSFAFFNSTHHNYLYPPEYEVDTPVLERDYDHFMGDDRLAAQRDAIVNRYRNSVRWVDALIGRLIDGLRAHAEREGRQLVVVVTGDHGEEFWEHGLLGHGAARYVDERIRVPLVMCLPGHPTPDVPLSSHADVMPTILDALGATIDGEALELGTFMDGHSMLDGTRQRPVWVGGLDFPWDHPDGALIGPSSKFWVRTCAGQSLCLEPFHVTDADDAPRPLSAERAALAEYVEGFLEDFDRFVEVRPRR